MTKSKTQKEIESFHNRFGYVIVKKSVNNQPGLYYWNGVEWFKVDSEEIVEVFPYKEGFPIGSKFYGPFENLGV